ncbi:hypothetical protein ACFO0A_00610 [Novosphingobium tardum]|uniref:DUF2786 domain-containing protein n=1 Tax=Novosphingobium tardum TaxID=1538021 RepID=A0ABV8RJG1_9SPHN
MSALDAAATARLVKFLGLLGSDHDGERATAGRMADLLVKAHGLTWADVISTRAAVDPFGTGDPCPWRPRSSGPQPVQVTRSHQKEAFNLLGCGFPWDSWKTDFLHSIRHRDGPLSGGQQDKLDECHRMAQDWRRMREAA